MHGFQITLAAEEDHWGICGHRFETWGPEQADNYLDEIEDCLDTTGTVQVRSRSFDRLPNGFYLHQCQHHYIFWIIMEHPTIIAVLHEKMDVMQRLADQICSPD